MARRKRTSAITMRPREDGGWTTFDEDEVKALILAACRGQGHAGATTEEIRRVINWAEGVRSDLVVLDLVLDGQVSIRVDEGGDWTVRAVEATEGDGHGGPGVEPLALVGPAPPARPRRRRAHPRRKRRV